MSRGNVTFLLMILSSYLKESRRTMVLAGPIIVGQVSQMLMSVTDSVMIGHVGKVPLAASAFAGSIWGMFFIVGVGMMISMTIKVSQAHGKADDREVATWMKHGVVLGGVVGLLGAVLMVALETQLHRFGQPPRCWRWRGHFTP